MTRTISAVLAVSVLWAAVVVATFHFAYGLGADYGCDWAQR